MTDTPSFLMEPQRGKDLPDALFAFLKDHRGRDVEIDMSQLTTLSGRQIELLLSGYRQWDAEGLTFAAVRADEALCARMAEFDLPAQIFSEGK